MQICKTKYVEKCSTYRLWRTSRHTQVACDDFRATYATCSLVLDFDVTTAIHATPVFVYRESGVSGPSRRHVRQMYGKPTLQPSGSVTLQCEASLLGFDMAQIGAHDDRHPPTTRVDWRATRRPHWSSTARRLGFQPVRRGMERSRSVDSSPVCDKSPAARRVLDHCGGVAHPG